MITKLGVIRVWLSTMECDNSTFQTVFQDGIWREDREIRFCGGLIIILLTSINTAMYYSL